jgi:hypothetical protein
MAFWEGAAERLAKGELFSGAEKVLNSNKGINQFAKVGDSLLGGGEAIARMMGKDGVGFKDAMNATFRTAKKVVGEDGVEKMVPGDLNVGKIAGSYIGASAAYRVLSGGGVFKDRNGNTNVIGIPFV